MKKSKARLCVLLIVVLHIGNVGTSSKPENISAACILAAHAPSTETGAFITERAPLAVHMMRIHGVPASIILAQAIIESDRGKSKLCAASNNYFGIKCSKKKCYCYGHIWKEDRGVWSRFVVYPNEYASFDDHSRLLCAGRYRSLRCDAGMSWDVWCDELLRKGYAVDKRYAKNLKQIIKKNNLDEYDNYASKQNPCPPSGTY
jgi:flagellum-specific peptidoglycan hydrolase FlgJ